MRAFFEKFLKSEKLKRFLIIPPIILGVLVVAVLKACSKGPEKEEPGEISRKVRIIEAPSVAVVPWAIGYGTAKPGKVWQSVAQVSGKIVEVHPQFEEGELLKAGTVILRIDPTQYEFATSQSEAREREIRAQLAELEINMENLNALLEIEERTLALNEKELKRKRELFSRNAIPASEADREEQNFLAQQNRVRQMQNEISLIPSKREKLQAQLALSGAQLADARYNLENTVIRLPFDARMAQTPVEISQFVNVGTLIAEADGVDVTEVVANVPLSMMRNLVDPGKGKPFAFTSDLNMANAIESFGLTARVRINDGAFEAEWEARVARLLEHMDPTTRTFGVVVAVDNPYLKVKPGVRPPLVKGMFCEVELRAKARPEQVIVPRAAWQDGSVYVADSASRLRKQPAEAAFAQTDFVVIASGVEPGDHVVVSDPIPAIEGMLLKVVNDTALQAQVIARATGAGEVK